MYLVMIFFVLLSTHVAVSGLIKVILRAAHRPTMADDHSDVSSQLRTVFRSQTNRYLFSVVNHLRRFLKLLCY